MKSVGPYFSIGTSLACVLFAAFACTTGAPRAAAPPEPESTTLERFVRVQDGATLGVGRRIELPDLITLDGKAFTPELAMRGHRAAVFVMTSAGCPVSADYAPRIAAIEEEYTKKGILFVYVNAVAAETSEEIRAQIGQYGFVGAYLPDRDRAVATALGARTTTEVFLLDPSWTLEYRGGVDDQYSVGAALDAPRRLFLRDALDALLAGERPPIAATWAPGCLVDSRPPTEAPAPDLTYYSRIARILDANCIDCHRPGGSAPFSLLGPQALQGRAAMVEAVVADGLMPPSHGVALPGGRASPWVNQVAMSARDRDDLLMWLRSSRPLGNSSQAPAMRERPAGWVIGPPDLLLLTPGFKPAPDGGLQHARIALATNTEADQWISAVEFKPVRQDSVQHALVWLLPPGATLPRPGESPEGLALLGAYSPGHEVIRYRDGAARLLPAGSLMIVDMYARPMGKVMPSALRIAMRTSTTRPSAEVRTLVLQDRALAIAPGAPLVRVSAQATLPITADLVAITPYMRARGRQISLEVRRPGGAAETLLNASRYDFRWQIRYELAEPMPVPAGTRLTARAVFSNSADDPRNPGPAAAVHAGSGPSDEAMFIAVDYEVPVAPGASGTLPTGPAAGPG